MAKPILTVTDKQKATFFSALIAAQIVDERDGLETIVVAHKDGDLIVKDNKQSSVSYEEGGNVVYGAKEVFQKLVSSFGDKLGGLSPQKEEWITFAFDRLLAGDFKSIQAALEELDDHLVLRTYLVGYEESIADIAVWGVMKGNVQILGMLKKATLPNLLRWFNHLQSIDSFNKALNILTEKKKVKSASANYDIALLDTENGVVTRFPPEPSGYLHIGHAKAAMLNAYFAEFYKGKLIVRFDDTNPTKEKQEYQDSILEDLATLGIKHDKLSYTSDYFDQLYDLAIKMIELGKAYCDDTEQMQMRAERMDGIPSKRRERTVEENLAIFDEMKKGTELGRKNCLRAKISIDDPNKAMRDPVIYRCNPTPHHRTGSKYLMYPTYDFACPVVDSLEGVTHALRTIEYRDRNAQYAWMIDALGLRKVHIWDFARMNFVRTLLSKRKLTWFVDQGHVWGWDDPRFPTVRGIIRRGMTVEALKQFILSQGPSKNVVNLEWGSLWALNKKVIDPVAPRFTAVSETKSVKAKVIGGPSRAHNEEKPKHQKYAAAGKKKVYYSDEILIDQADAASFKKGEEITLMNWGNAFVNTINKDGDVVTGLEFILHLEGDFKKTEKKITWLSTAQKLVPVELVDFDYLITKDKLEEEDKVENFLTPQTEFREKAIGDENVADIKEGDIIQFERKGFYRCDRAASADKPAVFFNIPTGRK